MLYLPNLQLTSSPRGKRRGVVLLVVITMLSLFAVVGLSFVFYAEAEAVASRYGNQSEQPLQPDVSAEMLLNYFLKEAIYDTDPSSTSALKGKSMAVNLYGGPGKFIPFDAGAGASPWTAA